MTPEIGEIVGRSFAVSLTATLLAAVFAVPLAVFLCLHSFRGKKVIVVITHSMLSIPAVVIGLCCYLFLTRNGPLGPLRLLYTPGAMVLAQAILSFPIAVSLTYAGLQPVAKPLRDTFWTLGAGPVRTLFSLLYEGRRQVLSAMIMAFSRVIGETGMTMMVGGNIKGYTRVMTTTVAMETLKGSFELAIWLGVILFVVALVLNVAVHLLVGDVHAPSL